MADEPKEVAMWCHICKALNAWVYLWVKPCPYCGTSQERARRKEPKEDDDE